MQIISQNYVVWNNPWWWFYSLCAELQIISQNYVVWNLCGAKVKQSQRLVANYITKLRGLKLNHRLLSPHEQSKLQIISQNYVVWNHSWECELYKEDEVANYITKLRGLKHSRNSPGLKIVFSCKLYHKTTWFETCKKSIVLHSNDVANYITKLRGLKLVRNQLCYTQMTLQIISQNYVVWNL